MPRKSNAVTLTWLNCKTEYKKPKSKAVNSKFCVKKCKDEFTSQFENKKCLGCDVIFKAKRGKKS